MIGARQNAAFCPVGSSTVTWQSYSPGGSWFSAMLKLRGIVFNRLSNPLVTSIGCVSNAFVCAAVEAHKCD